MLGKYDDKFTQEERSWIWENSSVAKALLDFIDRNGYKPDLSGLVIDVNTMSIEQILAALKKLMARPGEGTNLPDAEQLLLGKNTPSWAENIKKYYSDARRATIRTMARYNYSAAHENGESVANAYKHALFTCYHCESFGLSMAIQLCTAHEEQPNTLTSQMDNWNNNEGFKIWNSGERDFNRIDALIYAGVNAGDMRWIPRNSSLLVPTNR